LVVIDWLFASYILQDPPTTREQKQQLAFPFGMPASRVPLHPLPARGLFDRMGVDLAGPFMPSPAGNTHCMVVIEHVELLPLSDKTAAVHGVLTDNGREYEAEQLERCFIDHRHTSPDYPQADGAAERVVQVLKDACYEAADAAAWELAIPDLLRLGYRCSQQKSTRYSPYELLYGGVAPIIPPAVKERLLGLIDFEDPAAALASLQQRPAGCARPGNLLIAQHRDTRLRGTQRHSAICTGRYLAKPSFAPGDYVYVRRGNITDTLQFSQHNIVLRVETVGPLGVAVLLGRDGARTRRRVEQLRPCHLDIDPALSPQLFRPQRDLQYELCGSPHQAARMLLCDGCNTGWHTHCLHVVSSSAAGRAAVSAAAGRNEEPGRLLFRPRCRHEAAEALQGRRALRTRAGVRGGAAAAQQQSGVLEYLGALARPRHFVARWDNGTEEELTLEKSRADAT
ncbi:hypothetical protein TSOC_004161, partial [Tetrabaena socialis]